MYKTKTTQKEIKNTHQHVLKVEYCNLQTLLKYQDAFAYTSNGEGWCSDIYSIGNIAISTGRKSFGSINVSYDLANKYEEIAKSESNKYHNGDFDYYRLEEILTGLLYSFIDEAIATDGKGHDNVVEKPHYQFN